MHSALDLEVEVEQIAARGGGGGGEADLWSRELTGSRCRALRVNMQVGQVTLSQGHQVTESAQIRLQGGDRLSCSAHGDGQFGLGARAQMTGQLDVEPVDG